MTLMDIDLTTVIAGASVVVSVISLTESKKAKDNSDSTHLENRISTLEERSITHTVMQEAKDRERESDRIAINTLTAAVARLEGKIDMMLKKE